MVNPFTWIKERLFKPEMEPGVGSRQQGVGSRNGRMREINLNSEHSTR